MITCRKPTKSEYDQIVSLVNSADEIYHSIYTPQEFHERTCASESIEGLIEGEKKREYLCMVDEQNKIIGYASFRLKNDQTVWLSMIHIDPRHQGQGLGTLLLQQIEAIAKSLKASVLVLETDKKAIWAVSFYTKNSYQILSDEDMKEYPFDKILENNQVEGRYVFGKKLYT